MLKIAFQAMSGTCGNARIYEKPAEGVSKIHSDCPFWAPNRPLLVFGGMFLNAHPLDSPVYSGPQLKW